MIIHSIFPTPVYFSKLTRNLTDKELKIINDTRKDVYENEGNFTSMDTYILNKKDIHLTKIERPKSEKKLPRVIDGEFIKTQLLKIENLKTQNNPHHDILSWFKSFRSGKSKNTRY